MNFIITLKVDAKEMAFPQGSAGVFLWNRGFHVALQCSQRAVGCGGHSAAPAVWLCRASFDPLSPFLLPLSPPPQLFSQVLPQ